MLNILAKPKHSVSKCLLVLMLLPFQCTFFTFIVDDAIVSSTDQKCANGGAIHFEVCEYDFGARISRFISVVLQPRKQNVRF